MLEDREIVELLQKRQEQAVEEIQRAYGGKLYHIAMAILGDREDAEECVNETLWKVWKAAPPNPSVYLFAFLAKVCRNTALDRVNYRNAEKRRGILLELTAEMEQCIPDRMQDYRREGQELAALLNHFLGELPPEKRIIFVRRYWYGDTIGEIARRLQVSEAKIKMTLFRIRKRLRVYLEKEDYLL